MTLFCGLLYNEVFGSIRPYMDYVNTMFCYNPSNSFMRVLQKSNHPVENIETISLYQILYKYIQWYEFQMCRYVKVKHITKKKYTILQSILDNPFYGKTTKNAIVYEFGKVQRKLLALNRFAYLWKLNRADVAVNADLMFTDLNPNEDSCFVLYQNKKKFYFRITDLLRIIESALCHEWDEPFEIIPRYACNPYNKITFESVDYYNIYHHLLFHTRIAISPIFKAWIHYECDIPVFTIQCEKLIRQKSIEYFVATMTNNNITAYNDIIQMIRENRATRHWVIHPKYPRAKLVELFRSCLYYYYMIEYDVLSLEQKLLYEAKLWSKLLKISRAHPKLGQLPETRKHSFDNEPYYFNSFMFDPYRSGAAIPYTPFIFGAKEEDNDTIITHYEPNSTSEDSKIYFENSQEDDHQTITQEMMEENTKENIERNDQNNQEYLGGSEETEMETEMETETEKSEEIKSNKHPPSCQNISKRKKRLKSKQDKKIKPSESSAIPITNYFQSKPFSQFSHIFVSFSSSPKIIASFYRLNSTLFPFLLPSFLFTTDPRTMYNHLPIQMPYSYTSRDLAKFVHPADTITTNNFL